MNNLHQCRENFLGSTQLQTIFFMTCSHEIRIFLQIFRENYGGKVFVRIFVRELLIKLLQLF